MRVIEIPDDGIVRIPLMRGEDNVGEKRIDLRYLPTIDAVPVVRCVECYKRYKSWCPLYGGHMGSDMDDDFYCKFGKRRETDVSN